MQVCSGPKQQRDVEQVDRQNIACTTRFDEQMHWIRKEPQCVGLEQLSPPHDAIRGDVGKGCGTARGVHGAQRRVYEAQHVENDCGTEFSLTKCANAGKDRHDKALCFPSLTIRWQETQTETVAIDTHVPLYQPPPGPDTRQGWR